MALPARPGSLHAGPAELYCTKSGTSAVDAQVCGFSADGGRHENNVTVHLAPAASVLPQLCVRENCPGFLPDKETPVMATGADLTFVRVTRFDALLVLMRTKATDGYRPPRPSAVSELSLLTPPVQRPAQPGLKKRNGFSGPLKPLVSRRPNADTAGQQS